jgi:putative adenylate-forming enzyme
MNFKYKNKDRETNSFLYFLLASKYRFYHFNIEQIKNYQYKKLRNIVYYAYNHSSFFHNLYKGYDLDDVWSLPTTNKKMMMDNLSEYNTLGLNKEKLIRFCVEVEEKQDFARRFNGLNIGMSSGTSGNKGIIITTPREENYLRAAFFSRFSFIKGEKINLAFILRVTVPAFNIDKFGHKLTYISQLNALENIISKLNKLQPNIVSAPPSMHYILAKEKRGNKLKIKPKKLIAYAEVLYPEVKTFLENTYNCPVHEIYQCSEGSIAISCKCGFLHINEDLVAVEALDYNRKPVKAGKDCRKLIISDLHKISQPVIRYELNDIIRISDKKCKCGSGFRVIESIQGRADDLFWAEKNEGKDYQFIFPDYIRRAIIMSSESIEEYQAVQLEPQKILIRLVVSDISKIEKISNNIEDNIQKVFHSYNCKKPDVKVVYEKPEVNQNSNKLIRIYRKFEI